MIDINEQIGNEIADAYSAGFEDGKKHGRKLIELVEKWAEEKDLLHEENAGRQFMKFIEEVFEFRDEWLLMVHEYNKCSFGEEDDDPEVVEHGENMKLEMGDVFVTLIILCKQLQMDPVKCLEMAQEKIKDRKGKTIGGTFVKEEDIECYK